MEHSAAEILELVGSDNKKQRIMRRHLQLVIHIDGE